MKRFTRIISLMALAGIAGCTGTTAVSTATKAAIVAYVTDLTAGLTIGKALYDDTTLTADAIGGLAAIMAATSAIDKTTLPLIWQDGVKEVSGTTVLGTDLNAKLTAFNIDITSLAALKTLINSYNNTVKYFLSLTEEPTGAANIAVYNKLNKLSLGAAQATKATYDTELGKL